MSFYVSLQNGQLQRINLNWLSIKHQDIGGRWDGKVGWYGWSYFCLMTRSHDIIIEGTKNPYLKEVKV